MASVASAVETPFFLALADKFTLGIYVASGSGSNATWAINTECECVCVRASVEHLSLPTTENCAALASHVPHDGTRLD